MGLLTVFANFRIDSEERFLRMKDSFYSFSDADIEKWVINVRGSFKDQVVLFLQDKLGNKLRIYTLESKQGWFFDTRQMLPEINSKYVFFWVEDHVCVGGVKYFDAIVQGICNLKVEYFLYSWFMNGKVLEAFQKLKPFNDENLMYLNYDKSIHKQCISNYGGQFYIISCCSITSLNLFVSIVNANDPILKRWPVETPFDFEKAPQDIHWLPLKYAIPKNELFASIDDDINCPGYSLISRGLYPERLKRSILLETRKVNLEEQLFSWRRVKHFLKRSRFSYNFSLFCCKFWIKMRELINLILSRFILSSVNYRVDITNQS